MNELDPALKRLIKWYRESSDSKPEELPFGFCGPVLASVNQIQPPTLLQELQQTAWSLTCVSLALIVCAGLLLVSQPSTPEPAAEISSALNFVASNLPQ